MTDRDVSLFKLLARYTYLQRDYIQAFLGGETTHWRERLRDLCDAGYLERPEQQRQHYNANYRPLIYALADRGVDVLQERGLELTKPRARHNFAHELMASELMASFELGARETGVQIITWPDIVASPALPDATRRSDKPFNVPVRFDGKLHHIAADGTPFGIARVIDGRTSRYFFPGIEADCATEPVDAYDFARSSIVRKFTLWNQVREQEIHRSHFGFPNLLVPIVTTNKVRMRSMMAALDRLTKGQGSKLFLFKTYPAFTSFERPRPPSGHMLTEDWERVGYPPVNLVK